MANAQGGPVIRHIVIHKPGTAWQASVHFREQVGVQDHVRHYMKFFQEGKVLFGGPFLDNSGGMMVTTSDVTFEELKTFAEADPAVISGLLQIEVKPWMAAMEK